MDHPDLDAFIRTALPALPKGPLGIVIVEDEVEVEATLRHHLGLGFCALIQLGGTDLPLSEELAGQVHRIPVPTLRPGEAIGAVNRLIPRLAGRWLYYCYNAEFLFFPFCESRSIGELTTFVSEERRETVLCFVVDLYADDLGRFPDGVSREHAHLDRSGYFAAARKGPDGHPLERQLDFFGGVRWRFEEHIPPEKRRIDRVAIFRAAEGLELGEDHLFNLPEYNTYQCPWHNSPTAAIASFRTVKALRRNPGSRDEIHSFMWANAEPFRWHSRQLLDLGLMEPGQWF